MIFRALIAGFLALVSISASADYPPSFDAAKRQVWQIYKDNRFDQYCGCALGSRNAPDLASCGYTPRKNAKRASRTEIEHVVPAENLGRQFACWRQGGRDHCNATDPAFRDAHNDLVNLIPVVGEVNGDRSNFRFDELPGGYGQYGQCQFKVDFATRRAEPPPSMKGDIARIHFYMRDRHGLKLSSQQERLLSIWDRQDPVSEWEKIRDSRIYKLQGFSNNYVSGRRAEQVFHNSSPEQPAFSAGPVVAQGSGDFSCERKTCKAMTTCAEARHQLQVCGNRSLDRDGDGTPCEALCR
ncbi:endonuclease (plasmid) [Pseudomonas sp. FeN3W]|nr:endonuclease [Pseudomonas sp. FeN3W]